VLERVTVTGYVTPLREGGSLPALVEADNHDWSRQADPAKPFDARQHVLRGRATRLAEAHEKLAPLVTEPVLAAVTADVPAEWFGDRGADAYVEHLLRRAPLVPEVIRS
jgi:hypothetical protein